MYKYAKDNIPADRLPLAVNETDYNNVGTLFNVIKGLGLFSLGGGMLYAGIKEYKKRFMEASAPDHLRPSKLIKNRGQDTQIEIDPELLPDKAEEKVAYYTQRFLKEATESTSTESTTDSGNVTINFTAPKADDVANNIAGRRKIEVFEQQNSPNGYKFYDYYKDKPLGERLQAWLATFPNLRAGWFLPAATAATIGGWFLGSKGISYFSKLLGKDKQIVDYSDKAKEVYRESAKYLKDVAADNIDPVTGKRRKKKVKSAAASTESGASASASTKPTTSSKSAYEGPVISGDGTSSFYSLYGLLLGIPAALWIGRQTYNLTKGINDSQEELADRTHMIRAWQAANKERQYNYNVLTPELKDEPIDDAVLKSIKQKEKKLLNTTDKDDDNNEQLRYENYVFKHIRADRDAMI